MRKTFLFLSIVLIVGLVGMYLWLGSIKNKIFITQGKTVVSLRGVHEHFADKTPVNILLLGYGGGNHDGAYLTDSMMVVHIEPKLSKIVLISIPRDIWIKIPTDETTSGYWKINAGYTIGMDDQSYPNKQAQFKRQDGAGHMAEYLVSQITGFPIEYFIGMDFNGFTRVIDALGGVDITVETAFTDSQYPIDGKETDLCGYQPSAIATLDAQLVRTSPELVYPCRYETLHFDGGREHMDGARALAYVRSRHSPQDGTDFGRAKRQRNLLLAVRQKLLSVAFLPRMFSFMATLGDDFKTDLSPGDAKTLVENATTLKNTYEVKTLSIQDYLVDATSNDGQAILEPAEGLDNWTSIHNVIQDSISASAGQVAAIVRVKNGTAIPGLAGLAVNRLKDKGMRTLEPVDNVEQKVQQTTITVFDKNVNKGDLDALKNEFGIDTLFYSPATQSLYNVLVTVGNDYNLKEGKKILNEP